MRSTWALLRERMICPRRWGAPLCVLPVLMVLSSDGSTEPRSDAPIQQLNAPFEAKRQPRHKSFKRLRRPNRSTGRKRSKSPWSRAQSRRIMAMPQIGPVRRRAMRYDADPALLLRRPVPDIPQLPPSGLRHFTHSAIEKSLSPESIKRDCRDWMHKPSVCDVVRKRSQFTKLPDALIVPPNPKTASVLATFGIPAIDDVPPIFILRNQQIGTSAPEDPHGYLSIGGTK